SQPHTSPITTASNVQRMAWARPLLVPPRSTAEPAIARRTCGRACGGGRICGLARAALVRAVIDRDARMACAVQRRRAMTTTAMATEWPAGDTPTPTDAPIAPR